jgi:tetratricopeptide (TPR) repeat protein
MATLATDLNIRKFKSGDRAAETGIRPLEFLLVLVAAAAPYVATLHYGFVYDDNVQILGTPIVRSWRFVPSYFLKPVPIFASRYYRPLFFLWIRLSYSLWKTHAWPWHLTSILLHAAVCLLVLAVLRRYFHDVRCAMAGALIFAVHPAHVETVAWLSGCTDALMALGLLGALLLWMKSREGPSVALRVGSLVCCLMALLSKETAVMLPVLIWLHALAQIPSENTESGDSAGQLTSAFREAAPYIVTTAIYLTVRHIVLRGVPGSREWISRTQAILTIPSLLLFYVRHSIWPVASSLFYDFAIVSRAWSPSFWAPLILLAGMAVGIWIWFRRSHDWRVLLATLWFLIPILPVLNIRPFHPDDFLHDRYLYLAVLGLATLAGLLCESLWRCDEGAKSWLPLALVVVLVLSLALATAVQARPWENDLSLYENAVRLAPDNSSGWNNLASTYLTNGRYDEATNVLTHVLKGAPTNTTAWNNLASEYITEGRYDEAGDVLRRLLKDHPKMWLANYNYGYLNYRIGNFIVAEVYLQRAIQIDQQDPDQYVYLGSSYFKQGRFREAADELRLGIARDPEGWGYHSSLGLVIMKQGDLAAARQELLTELRYHPDNGVAHSIFEQLDKQIAAQHGAAQ